MYLALVVDKNKALASLDQLLMIAAGVLAVLLGVMVPLSHGWLVA
jgi:hypothetical protein